MILIAPEKSYDIVNVKKNSLQLIMVNTCGKYYVAETTVGKILRRHCNENTMSIIEIS